jgi:hypothetical protein
MNDAENDLLVRELEKVGARGGELGSKIADVAEFAGKAGGSLGARLAAEFLPTEQFQMKFEIEMDAQNVLANLYAFFTNNGRLANSYEAAESPLPKVSGVVGSGFFKMNPAIVHAELLAVENGVCTVLVTSAAKEGLIKQRTAQKAVRRVVESMQDS